MLCEEAPPITGRKLKRAVLMVSIQKSWQQWVLFPVRLMDDLLGICDDGCLDETEGILQRIWSKTRRRMPCEPAAVGLWYGGTLLADCSRFIAMELTAKTYLQNKALEISVECCLDETKDLAEDLVQEELCELDTMWYGMRTLLAVCRFHCYGIWWQKHVAQQALELGTQKWMFVGMWVCATYIKCISCMMTLWRTEKRDSHMCVTIARSWVLPFGLHHQQSHLLLLYTFQESLECVVMTSTLPTKIHLQRIVQRATNCKKLIAKDSYVCVFP